MAARSTIVVDKPGLVVVKVTHGVADSFSRSVMPASTRAWKRAAHRGAATTHRVAELAPDFTVDGQTCASYIAFSATFPAARAHLEAYLDFINPTVSTPR